MKIAQLFLFAIWITIIFISTYGFLFLWMHVVWSNHQSDFQHLATSCFGIRLAFTSTDMWTSRVVVTVTIRKCKHQKPSYSSEVTVWAASEHDFSQTDHITHFQWVSSTSSSNLPWQINLHERWVINWPPRSPIPLDFFLWGYLNCTSIIRHLRCRWEKIFFRKWQPI